MTERQMQNYLDQQAKEGKTKAEALEGLPEMLNLRWKGERIGE